MRRFKSLEVPRLRFFVSSAPVILGIGFSDLQSGFLPFDLKLLHPGAPVLIMVANVVGEEESDLGPEIPHPHLDGMI